MLPSNRSAKALVLFAAVCAVLATNQTAAFAQSVLAIVPETCVFQRGDDLRWAMPSLDESGWQPYSEWHADLAHPRLWIRCHASLAGIRDAVQPAIQVRLYGAYELYLDGNQIGTAGNLATGDFSLDVIRSYVLGQSQISNAPQVIALRVFDRSWLYNTGTLRSIIHRPLRISLGDSPLLNAFRAEEVVDGARSQAVTTISYSIIGILSIPLLALFAFDRSRKAVLLLALYVLFLAALRWNEFAVATFADYSMTSAIWIEIICRSAAIFAGYPFYFVLAGRRTPWFSQSLMVIAALNSLPLLLDALPINRLTWLVSQNTSVLELIVFLALIALTSSPYIAFWPFSAVTPRMRPIALLCMLWTAADFVWFLLAITAMPVPGVPNLYARWGLTLLNARGVITTLSVVTLFALLFREQRHIALDRATLAGELEAAGEIQRMLAPTKIDTVPGVRIEVAFHPMREVGGDFCLCRVLPNGRQRVLLGDVSGKGTAAAMAATLLLGAATARDSDTPASLLAHLNRVLCDHGLGGFATCLCADLAAGGKMTIANAGHMAPYLDGKEVPVSGSLPLGIAEDACPEEIELKLNPGESVVMLSDGVVEARNASGELFGFDRTAAISTQAAEEIARAAQHFGQEDDITVLTLTRLSVPGQAGA